MARIKPAPFATIDAARAHFDGLSLEAKADARRRARLILADPSYRHFSDEYYRSKRAQQTALVNAWAVVREVREMGSVPLFALGKEGTEAFFNYTDAIRDVSTLIELIDVYRDTKALDFDLFESVALKTDFVEEAIASSQFEGASTTTDEARALIQREKSPSTTGERMVLGNLLLMRKAWELRKSPFGVGLLESLHAEVAAFLDPDEYGAGAIRTSDDVYVAEAGKAVHVPPPAASLRTQIESLGRWFDETEKADDLHPWIVGAVLHFMIGWLHPFRDGNGRVARAIFYWVLFRSEYSWFKDVSLTRALQAAPKRYSQGYLLSERETFDLTYFLQSQALALLDELDDFDDRVRGNQELLDLIRADHSTPSRELLICRVAEDVLGRPAGYASVKSVASSLKISESTARRGLDLLVAKGYFSTQERWREKVYFARELELGADF